MKQLLAIALLAVAACATSDDRRPPDDSYGPPRREATRRMPMRDGASELTLPNGWWHDPAIAEQLELSSDQFQRLQGLRATQDDIAKLENDELVAARDFRAALEASSPVAADIVSAGKRLREMRDTVLARQIDLLAAQREILTADQWRRLQRELAEERMDRRDMRRRDDGFGRRGGGRGGRGGRRPW